MEEAAGRSQPGVRDSGGSQGAGHRHQMRDGDAVGVQGLYVSVYRARKPGTVTLRPNIGQLTDVPAWS